MSNIKDNKIKNIKKAKRDDEIRAAIFCTILVAFAINSILGTVILIVTILYTIINHKKILLSIKNTTKYGMGLSDISDEVSFEEEAIIMDDTNEVDIIVQGKQIIVPLVSSVILSKKIRLEKRKKYLHIALNSDLKEAGDIISKLPPSDRILIEAGTPLIKLFGTKAVTRIKQLAPVGSYIVADIKCSDMASREVEIMADAGANAVTCLGVAPIETIDSFIEACQKHNIDSMIDMMNVESALAVLKKLKKLPNVVMLHRGVDESDKSKEKQIPYYQIKQIKGNFNVIVAVAGGDTIKEIQQAIFNDADIVVVWKNFYKSNTETAELAKSFLKEIS